MKVMNSVKHRRLLVPTGRELVDSNNYQTICEEPSCLVPYGWLRSLYEGDEFGETSAFVGADGTGVGGSGLGDGGNSADGDLPCGDAGGGSAFCAGDGAKGAFPNAAADV